MNAIPAELLPEVDAAAQQRVSKMVTEFLDARCPTNYTWSYESSRADLRALYEKAKGEQWDGRTYLAWDTPVDPGDETIPDQQIAIYGSHIWNQLSPANIRELRQHAKSFTYSNFLHGEQGRCWRRRRSSTRARAPTPSSTPRRRSWTRRATSRSTSVTCARRSSSPTRSTST
jgi:hypothetical protein